MGTGHAWVIYPVRAHHQGAPPSVILLLKRLLTRIQDDPDIPQQECNFTWYTTINTSTVQVSLPVALELSFVPSNTIMPTHWYVNWVCRNNRTEKRISVWCLCLSIQTITFDQLLVGFLFSAYRLHIHLDHI